MPPAEYIPPPGFVVDETISPVSDYWDWAHIQDDKSIVRTGRLASWLRKAAQTRDPQEILRRAVLTFLPTFVSGDHMGQLTLRIGQLGQEVTLRATLMLPAAPGADPLPDIARRRIPAPTAFADALRNRDAARYDELFLFIHGLASTADESETFKRSLIEKGAARGRRYAVLSVDLPGMGYSSRIDIDNLVAQRAGAGHHGFKLCDGVGSHFPLLGLYRDTLVEICNTIAGGVQYVMGGSLGGNMTLWLAAEPMFTDLVPERAEPSSVLRFLGWSPGSIWGSYERARELGHLFEPTCTYSDDPQAAVSRRWRE